LGYFFRGFDKICVGSHFGRFFSQIHLVTLVEIHRFETDFYRTVVEKRIQEAKDPKHERRFAQSKL
jgi:hypothetical protein